MATITRILPAENLFAFANEQISKKEEIQPKQRFEVGKHYSLQTTEFDGLTPNEEDVYELVGIVNTVNNVPFESLIMKPIRVTTSMMFSLNKIDCQNLGIEYQQGLQLFPMGMEWVCVNEQPTEEHIDREFDDDDLSTYPVDRESLEVRFMTIRLVGFSNAGPNTIMTPNKTIIRPQDLKINYKNNLPNELSAFSSKPLSGRVVTGAFVHDMDNRLCVDNRTHSIFIEIDMRYQDLSNNKVYGIKPSLLQGKNINDLIQVSWEERVSQPRYSDDYYYGSSVARNEVDRVLQGLALTNRGREHYRKNPDALWNVLETRTLRSIL